MEGMLEFAKQGKARAIKRMKAWLNQEEFDAMVAKHIALGHFTAEEVTEALEGFDMETDMKSPVERAVALVGEHGELTSGQLHAMLKLADDECPSEVLAEALGDGLLIKEGKYWTLPTEHDKRLDTHYMPTPAQIAAFPRPIMAQRRDVRTYEEKAVEFLRAQPNQRCTNKQMIYLLQYPGQARAALHRALERKLLMRDGEDWILGPNRRTQVEQAMDYLRTHPERRASNSEMCGLFGYPPKAVIALNNTLQSGLLSGRLARDGGKWTLGEFAEAA